MNRLPPLLAGVALLLAAAPSTAQICSPGGTICDGDVLVVDLLAERVIKVDLATGAQTFVDTGGVIEDFPRGITHDRNGRLFITVQEGIVRALPDQNLQNFFDLSLTAPARDIVKRRDSLVTFSHVAINSFPFLFQLDPVLGVFGEFASEGMGRPTGLVFDPRPVDPESEFLVSDTGNVIIQEPPIRSGVYQIDTFGAVTPIAREGHLAIAHRLVADASGTRVFVTDLGGQVGTTGEIVPPQIVVVELDGPPTQVAFPGIDSTADVDVTTDQITVAGHGLATADGPLLLDLDDGELPEGLSTGVDYYAIPEGANALRLAVSPGNASSGSAVDITAVAEGTFTLNAFDFKANQTPLTVTGPDLLQTPVGIALHPTQADTLLVVDKDTNGGALIEVAITSTTTWNSTHTVVSDGQLFDIPWGIGVVSGLDPAVAAPLYVTDAGANAADTGVFAVRWGDPTPTRVAVHSGAPYVRPAGLNVNPNDPTQLIVADTGADAIFLQNEAGGAPTLLSSGGMLIDPTDVAVQADGTVAVTLATAKVVAVDLGTGAQALISEDGFLRNPTGIVVTNFGTLGVTDAGAPGDPGRLIEIDPNDGFQDCIVEGNVGGGAISLDGVFGIAIDLDASTILSIDNAVPLVRSLTTAISTSSQFQTPRGVQLEETRDLVVVDAGNPAIAGDGRVLRVFTGVDDPIEVAQSAGLQDPIGIAVAGLFDLAVPAVDTDADGVIDLRDNCIDVANPAQENANDPEGEEDEFGDACDDNLECDATLDGAVGVPDFTIFLAESGNDCVSNSGLTCNSDCTGDDIVGIPDFNIFLAQNGESEGPAGPAVGIDPACNQ